MSRAAPDRPAPFAEETVPSGDDGPLMTVKDYALLNRRTSELGSFIGFGGGGALTYGLYRATLPVPPSRNILFLAFFSSSTAISYFSTHLLLTRRLAAIRSGDTPIPHKPSDTQTIGESIFGARTRSTASDRTDTTGPDTGARGPGIGKGHQEDPDLGSWKAGHLQDGSQRAWEHGVGGQEELMDKYATTRGDH